MLFARVYPVDLTHIHDSVVMHTQALVDYLPSVSPSLARIPVPSRRTQIGRDTEIMPFAMVYRGASIGARCLIGSHATVREDATVGDGCVIGMYACVSYDAVLGSNVRVQNGTLIADGWQIGDGTFVGVNVSTMSDRRRDVVEYEFKGSTPSVIGKRCLIGSGAVILPGLTIGDDVVIGAGALVTRNVPSGATVLGQPARIVGEEVAQIVMQRRLSQAAQEAMNAQTTVHGVDHWDETGER